MIEILLFLLFAVISTLLAYWWIGAIRRGSDIAAVTAVIFSAVVLYGLFRSWVA